MTVIPRLEACKKRKEMPKVYGFNSFGEPGHPLLPQGPFRDNIRLFLQQCAELESYSVQGMPIWCTLLVHDNRSLVVPLYIIEEDVKTSDTPFCDHCRCTGWGNHFVSKRKYHVIIPVDDDRNKPLDDGILDLSTHLLHGFIHCNGFAHLLCINGLEGGSKHLCGRELMGLWDRICINLRTRKITVKDVSKKRSMELRLLHGVAYGHPWFGRWGYKFCHGSFGVKEHIYERALEILSSLELEKIIQDFSGMDQSQELKKIVRNYRYLSEAQLVTIRDLLRFMLTLKACFPGHSNSLLPTAKPADVIEKAKPATRESLKIKPLMKEKSSKYRKFATVVSDIDSRWPARRLESAADVIVNAIKEQKEKDFRNGGMARQDVRDAARLHIGDTGLLDYVLKSLNNVVVGNQVVCRSVNPTTQILEYTVHDLNDRDKVSEPVKEILALRPPPAALVPGIDVYGDVLYLYEHVLLGYPESGLVELATQAVLDTKHFVKECLFRDEKEQLLTLFCQFLPSLNDKEIEFRRELPPGEIVVMPLDATVGELKQEAESALRDTYCITEQFVVMEIKGLEESDDMDVLSGAVQSGTEVGVRGSGIDLDTPLRYQGGSDIWMVRCECGATDDGGGERMVACDICEVWQHTRCRGMEDAEEGGSKHLCGREPMDIWDQICVNLPTRKITVEDVSKKRSMELYLLEIPDRGSTNICVRLPGLLIVGVDSRVSIDEPKFKIMNEAFHKFRFFGNLIATMCGEVKQCYDVWQHMEKYAHLNPKDRSVYKMAMSAYEYILQLKQGEIGMFIGSVEQGVAVVYQLDNDNQENDYHRRRLKCVKAPYAVMGTGSEYALEELDKWDNISPKDAVVCTWRGLLAAALGDPYTGGELFVFVWDVLSKRFHMEQRKVMEAYKDYYQTLVADLQNAVFILYAEDVDESDIRSIVDVSHYGHPLAKTVTGLFVRRLVFKQETDRDKFFTKAKKVKCLPRLFYDRGKLLQKYECLRHTRYMRVNGKLLFVAKPSKKFLEALETNFVTSTTNFPMHLFTW